MKKVILITGANGMLAKTLAAQLSENYSIRFLTRKVRKANEFKWDIENKYIDPESLKGVHTIIHIAGSSISDKRWTNNRKKIILSSRIDSANLILNELKRQNLTIDSFFSASAIGYYGTITTGETFNENSPNGNDFLSMVCEKWENKSKEFVSSQIAKRNVIIRIGVILDKKGGALPKLIRPIRLLIGAPLGTGNQYIPWIHIHDLVRVFQKILDNKQINGTFNAVAPEHITNAEMTRAIAQQIKKPLFLPKIPKFIIRLFFGEKSIILLEGNRVSSKKLLDTKFKFKFDKLKDALKHLVK